MKKLPKQLDPEANENLRRYAETVYRIYEQIKDTPAGEQLRLKAQWRKRFDKDKGDSDVSYNE